MQKSLLPLLFLLLFSFCSFAQQSHHSPGGDAGHESFKPWRIAVMLGHTSVPSGEKPEHVFIPSWGFDFEYWFNEKLALGSHNDIEVESFIVEVDHQELIEREYPLVTTLEVLYKPWKGLVLQVGGGLEHEKAKNYTVLRYGVEYEFHLPGGWDLFPTVFYDTRINAFDTWSLGLGVGKRL